MDYYFDYGFDYGYPALGDMMTEFGIVIIGIVAVIALFMLSIGAVFYVFRSLGFYTVAKRRGLRSAWMAWVPVLRYWIVGSLSDQYQYVVKGRIRNKRKTLLILGAGSAVVGLIQQILWLVVLVMDPYEAPFAGSIFSLITTLTGAGLSISAAVIYYMAMYDVYTSFSPSNSIMFLVLSIVFKVTEPFFVFFNRYKDEGMPPRRIAPEL